MKPTKRGGSASLTGQAEHHPRRPTVQITWGGPLRNKGAFAFCSHRMNVLKTNPDMTRAHAHVTAPSHPPLAALGSPTSRWSQSTNNIQTLFSPCPFALSIKAKFPAPCLRVL